MKSKTLIAIAEYKDSIYCSEFWLRTSVQSVRFVPHKQTSVIADAAERRRHASNWGSLYNNPRTPRNNTSRQNLWQYFKNQKKYPIRDNFATLSPCPLRPNVTSSIKPEVHNVAQLRRRRTEPRPQGICIQTFVMIGPAVPEICLWRDRQTHRQTGWSQYSAPLPGRSDKNRMPLLDILIWR